MESKRKKKNKNFINNNKPNQDDKNQNGNKNNINDTSKEKVKYFLMFPLEDGNFIETFNSISNKLKNEKPKDFDENLLIKPQKLHITLAVLDINENKEKTEIIINSINSLLNSIKDIIDNELFFNFDKFDVFGTITKSYVIFAKMIEDENHYKLKMITNLIISKLIEQQIINKSDLSKFNISEEYSDSQLIYVIKFHCTLLNIKYLNTVLEEENKPLKTNIDATQILQCIKNIKFPECKIDKINLCAMREDSSNGKYEIIHSFQLFQN